MKKIISGSTLKILAMIFMVIDHFGQVVLKNGIILHAPYSMFTDEQFDMLMSTVNICHILGRIAFPVFCFLLVEGFFHTHNLKKYILNLGIFALISEPVYDLACAGTLFSLGQQNVLFTLLLGLIILTIIKRSHKNVIISFAAIVVGAYISYICNLDGWYYGIALISVFYLFYDMPALKYTASILVMYICGLNFTISGFIDPYFLTAATSLLFISMYNGERGMKMKYFFYIFGCIQHHIISSFPGKLFNKANHSSIKRISQNRILIILMIIDHNCNQLRTCFIQHPQAHFGHIALFFN